MNKLSARQRGDTIVEVLIAIAVSSALLMITYSTMNRNTAVIRANQERSEAIRLAQGQIESLTRLLARGEIGPTDTVFCINPDVKTMSSAPNQDDMAADNFAVYENAGCKKDYYHFAISRQGSSNNYRVYVRWYRFGANDQRDQIIMAYRARE